MGRGGEATLYLAEVTLAGQTEPVVVKVLNSEVTANEEQFAELSAKWGEQAELLRFINRLGVVGVREHFEGAPEHPADGAAESTDRALYLVMNYVEGVDLRDWRAEHAVEGPRGQREVLRYLEQIALVLDVLHSGRATPSKRVVVHGDLSPGNIMISDEGQATLVDFGLSRIAARHMTARPWFTPGYAAPEIFNGEYSAATDRYAFGAIAFFALTGEDPPPSPEQLRDRFGALPLVAAAGERQRVLVMSMFSAEPGERPEASDWIRALRSLATSVPWTGPVAEPGDAVFAAAVAEAPAEPAGPEGGEAPPEPAVPAAAPPSGERVSGPPPESGPVADRPGAEPPAPDTRAETPSGASDMAPRPVGGMRGRPQAEQDPAASGPVAAAPPAPTGGPVGGTPSGPAAHPGHPAGPPPGGPMPPQSRPVSGPQPSRPVPPPPGRAPGGPTHHGPAMTGPQPVWSGPAAPPPTGAFSQPVAAAAEAGVPPKRRSRKPLFVGFAIFGVVCLVGGAAGTYWVMDRVVPVVAADGTGSAADQALDEPSEDTTAPAEPTAADPAEAGDEPTAGPGTDMTADPSPAESGAPDDTEPGTTLLTQLDPVDQDGRWTHDVGRAEMNARVYSRALVSPEVCGGDYADCNGWVDYNLSRAYTSFTTTIGVDDTSSASETVTFTVYADDESLISETVRLGETIDLDVDVTDVLRLRLEVESSDDGIYPVWAEPALTS
ncbi:NPCBM/NEW2 domain-containing protein [Nocardiopsis sp. EMB25]|nr:NPCBM/NEW2 domain-containing protein [Nocardiopsis sp. EMB25]